MTTYAQSAAKRVASSQFCSSNALLNMLRTNMKVIVVNEDMNILRWSQVIQIGLLDSNAHPHRGEFVLGAL